MIKVGDSLRNNHYKLIHLIAESPATTLFIGLDTETRELLAIKVVERKVGWHEEFIKAFRNEAKVLSEFRDDPHITRIYHFDIENEYLYIAMEYVPGRNIAEALKAGGPMNESDALKIARDVAEALQAVHLKGIVHSDLKPSNIILTPPGVTKVVDFGMALDVSRITTSQFRGTPAYMSPEQVDSAKFGTPNIQSDIYSLGATLYEMLSGKPPFYGTNPLQLALEIVDKQPTPLRVYRDDILPATEELVMRCLKKYPEARYQSPRELLDALDVCLKDQDEDPGYARFKQARRNFDQEQWEQAIEWAQRVPANSPCQEEAADLIRKAQKRLDDEKTKRKIRDFDKAMLEGNYELAATLQKELEKLDPGTTRQVPTPDERPRPRLVSVSSGKEYLLTGATVRIGRLTPDNPAVDINLSKEENGNFVHRNHAHIVREPNGTWFLQVNQGNVNETRVNDQVVEPGARLEIKEGDILIFYKVKLAFHTGNLAPS